MDSGKYLLLGISVTPLSLDLPLLVLLAKVPLDIDGDGGAGEHLATVMAPPDRLRLFEHETGPTKHRCFGVAVHWLEGGSIIFLFLFRVYKP